MSEIEAKKRDIILNKLEEIDTKISNFMGFFRLPPDEMEELETDIKAVEKGKLKTYPVDELRDAPQFHKNR